MTNKVFKTALKGPVGFLLVVLLAASSAGCDRDRNHPGWDFFPDMYYSIAYETNSPNPVFDDGKTMRTPVEGTIPRGIVPHPYPNTIEGMTQAGMELINPMEATPGNIESGMQSYQVFCLMCHGENGDGKGFLHTSGKYIYPPASLISKKMVDKPDGEIYHSITVGYGIMGAHGSLILPEDRWHIVLYIRDRLQVDDGEE
jgi:hypothetical protein